jgi:hypothetical protein
VYTDNFLIVDGIISINLRQYDPAEDEWWVSVDARPMFEILLPQYDSWGPMRWTPEFPVLRFNDDMSSVPS